MSKPISLGISTCPNDTFAFHAILNNQIDLNGLNFEIELRDVQELNESIQSGLYDVAKASFHAALLNTHETVVLSPGSALGFGVGPVLLSHQAEESPEQFAVHQNPRILCPGALTTATLLFQLFHCCGGIRSGQVVTHPNHPDPFQPEIEQVVFSDIMLRLKNKSADFGVCIHEGRFAYSDYQLHLIEDLGRTWENATQCPLPLGGILARRSLGSEQISKIQTVIRRSIKYALENREETIPTMKKYGQEFSSDVLFSHVDLYVNDWTLDLGDVGRNALSKLNAIAKASGLVRPHHVELEVFA